MNTKWNATSIYEVNLRQLSEQGGFTALETELPRLKKMGISLIWLMPITPISMHKRLGKLGSYYACRSYTEVNPEFGSLEDFQSLVETAHSFGLRIIIDWVANHTGWDHEWTVAHPSWYAKDKDGNFTEKNGWEDVIDLDYGQTDLWAGMIAAMQYWIKTADIDGFRCDMAHLVPLPFWKAAKQACDNIKKLFWLAETDDDTYLEVFDVNYAWEWMHKTEQFFRHEINFEACLKTLKNYLLLPKNRFKLLFTTNHDENSWNGTEYEKYHQGALPLAVLSCVWERSIPLIYNGQEIPNYKRLAFFEKDSIDWQKELKLTSFYTALLHLRKDTLAIQEGETVILSTNYVNILAFLRIKDSSIVLVILNFSTEGKICITIENPYLKGYFKNIFSTIEYEFNTTQNFYLEGLDYLVYKKSV